ncbi:MAG: FG-GAP-like repeat-containing protein [Phycisphaerales bacterium]
MPQTTAPLALGTLALTVLPAAALAQDCDPAQLFAEPVRIPAQAVDAATIVSADFNGDGITDIATEGNAGVGFVNVLLGDGAGGFGPPTAFATNQARPWGLSVGDVNGDGFVDIACGNVEGPDIAVLLGNGDGTFQDPIAVALAIPQSLETGLADFDGDGVLDLIASDFDNNRLWLLRGGGDGTFSGATPIPAGLLPSYFTIADTDGDGNLDLVVANDASDDVSIIRGNGRGQFFAQQRFGTGLNPHRPVVADVNADGVPDIVVGNFGSDSVSVLLGIDGLDYQPRVDYPVGDEPRHVRLADFTGDAVTDVIVTNARSDDASLLVGVGDGTFESEFRFAAADGPIDGAAFDADDNGAFDLVVVNRLSQDLTPLLNTCVPGLFITTQPQDAIADVGAAAVFEVQASGPEPIAYQWLFNGGEIPGATQATLDVASVGPLDMGFYSVRVEAGAESVVSDAARLAVFNPCPGDFDGDGTLTIFDFLAFQNAFSAGCP